jgi:gamma-glutamylcyclotransferase (GGCT)/AIG2-like uncharacterized protein YtfP
MSDSPSNPPDPERLRVFVYGTLKRGGHFHDRFCRGFVDVREACVRGRLWQLEVGYPTIVIDGGDILADGTTRPLEDVRAQRTAPQGSPPTDSERVWGEIFEFDDPHVRLPGLDGLEDFRPPREGMYRRVLVSAWDRDGVPHTAWTYVSPRPEPPGRPTGRSTWP